MYLSSFFLQSSLLRRHIRLTKARLSFSDTILHSRGWSCFYSTTSSSPLESTTKSFSKESHGDDAISFHSLDVGVPSSSETLGSTGVFEKKLISLTRFPEENLKMDHDHHHDHDHDHVNAAAYSREKVDIDACSSFEQKTHDSIPFLSAHELTVERIMQAQLHLGHIHSKFCSRNLPYILGSRHGMYLFDAQFTLSQLRRAAYFLRLLSQSHGLALFVSNRLELHDLTVRCAQHAQGYYCTEWRPGTLTNLNQMVLKKTNPKRHPGILPDVVIFLDLCERTMVAVKEARRMYIPSIALIDSDQDERWVTYPVPGNDDGMEGVQLFAGTLAQALKEGKSTLSSKPMVLF